MSATPAGWYPDPIAPAASLRYWDGSGWTAQVSPVAQPAMLPPQPLSPSPGPAAPRRGQWAGTAGTPTPAPRRGLLGAVERIPAGFRVLTSLLMIGGGIALFVSALIPDPLPPPGGARPAEIDGYEILDVSSDMIESVIEGANEYELAALDSAAVISTDYGTPLVYVAVEMDDGSGERWVGVWASGKLDGSSFVWSVDAFAQEFTDYPNGRVDFRPAVTDPAAQAAKAALEDY